MRMRAFLLPLMLLGTAADAPPIAALGALQPGRWQLTSDDASFAGRSLCLGDPQVLLQLQHGAAQCSHFVITNDPMTATVQYSCAAAGNGRTTVRVETPRLAQVMTQGIAANQPFDLSIHARRIGECSGPNLSRR